MSSSVKKFPKRVIAVLIALMIVVSTVSVSFAKEGGRDLTVTRTISNDLTIDADTVVGSDEVWEVASDATLTVSGATLTVNGSIIFKGINGLATEKKHDVEKDIDVEGALVIREGGAYITTNADSQQLEYLFGHEAVKDSSDAPISPIVMLDEQVDVKVEADKDSGKVKYTLSSAQDALADIIGEFALDENTSLVCGEKVELNVNKSDGNNGSLSAETGACIYNDSKDSASVVNGVANATVYHKVTVTDATATNKSGYVKTVIDEAGNATRDKYTVNAPAGKKISSLTVGGTGKDDAVGKETYSFEVQNPLSVVVDFDDIIYPDFSTNAISYPEYVVVNEQFNVVIKTNTATQSVKVNGTDYTACEVTETEKVWTVALTAPATAGDMPLSIVAGENTQSATIKVVEKISLAVSAKSNGAEYTSGNWTKNNVEFTIEAKGGIPESKVYFKSGEEEAVVLEGTTKTVSESGTYTFYAVDANGAKTNEFVYEVKIDKDAPELDVTLNPDTNDWSKKVTVTVTASDAGSGIETVKYKNGADENETTITLVNGISSFDIDVDTSKNTEFTFTATDALGNSKVVTKNIKVDAVNPSVNITVNKNGAAQTFIEIITAGIIKVNSTEYSVKVDAEDDTSGVKSLKCYLLKEDELDKVDEKTPVAEADGSEVSFTFDGLDDNETYTIYTVVKDKAGNEAKGDLTFKNVNSKVKFELDNLNEWTAKVNGEEVDGSETIYVDSDFTFNAIASKPNKVKSLKIAFNDSTNDGELVAVNYNVNKEDTEGFYIDKGILNSVFEIGDGTFCKDGKYLITLISDDDRSTSYTIVKDSAEPKFTVAISDEDFVRTEKTITITLKETQVSGIASVTVDGNTVEKDGNGEYKYVATQNGSHEVVVTSNAGKSSTKKAKIRKINANNPVLVVTGTEPNGKNGWLKADNYVITLGVENAETQGTIEYKMLEGENYVAVTLNENNQYIITDDMKKEYTFKAIGENGLESEPETIEVKKDKVAPTAGEITFTSKNEVEGGFIQRILASLGLINWLSKDDPVKITIENINDDVSGIKKIFLCNYDGENIVPLGDKYSWEAEGTPENHLDSYVFEIDESISSTIVVVIEDEAGNQLIKSTDSTVTIDVNDPTITFDTDVEPIRVVDRENGSMSYFNEAVKVVVTIFDDQLDAENMSVLVNGIEIALSPAGDESPNTYTAEYEATENGVYKVEVNAKDVLGHDSSEEYNFTVDSIPTTIDFGFSKDLAKNENGIVSISSDTVDVYVLVTEPNFDVDNTTIKVKGEEKSVSWSVKDGEPDVHVATVQLGKGEDVYDIEVDAVSYAQENATKGTISVILDKTAPTYSIKYNPNPVKQVLNDITLGLFFKETVTVTVTVEDNVSGIASVIMKGSNTLDKTDETYYDESYESFENTKDYTFNIAPDFVGSLAISATDYVGNGSAATCAVIADESPEGFEYTDVQLIVENDPPKVDISLDEPASNIGAESDKEKPEGAVNVWEDAENGAQIKYYNGGKTVKATITVTEKYFDAINSTVCVVAKNSDGELSNEDNKLYEISSDWEAKANDTYVRTVTFKGEANYSIKVNAKDYATNETVKTDYLTIDNTNPEYNITYSYDPIKAVINSATFGLFFKDSVDVTVTVSDKTSGIKNVKIEGTLGDGVSTENENFDAISEDLPEGNNSYSKTFTIAPQFRGTFAVEVLDYATNKASDTTYKDITNQYKDDVPEEATDAQVIVDDVAPAISEIEIISNKGIINRENIGTENFAKDSVKATFSITEANFFEEDVIIEITSVNDQGEANTYKYVGGKLEGSEENLFAYECKRDETSDVYNFSLTFVDENDYTITVTYTDEYAGKPSDRSGNEVTPVTKSFTIDKTAPVIDVEYGKYIDNTYESVSPKKTGLEANGSIDYYSEDRVTATITVTEHNFDTKNSVITVVSSNLASGQEKTSTFNDTQWYLKDTNVYEARVTLNSDSNYSINVTYNDYSKNETVDYNHLVTVDKTAPTVEVEFSADPLKAFINNVTLGLFFNDSVKVTVKATDPVSGLESLDYSGKLELSGSIDTEITPVNKTYDEKTYTKTEEFTISPQYRGTITVSVNDHSTNNYTTNYKDIIKNVDAIPSEVTDNTVVEVVVDNIKPVIDVKYDIVSAGSGDAAHGSVSYYNSQVVATVTINEHNFDSANSVITVTAKDVNGETLSNSGNSLYTISSWNPSDMVSGDSHVATVTFKGDANYSINVKSTDHAGNDAVEYNKNLTVDKTAPVLTVDDISYAKVDNDTDFNSVTKYADYKYFANGKVNVTVKASDATSGVKSLSFYTIDYTNDINGEKVELTPYSQEEQKGTITYTFAMDPNFKGNIYVQAEDYSTNKSVGDADDGYTKSYGIVLENIEMHEGIVLSRDESIIPGRAPNENGFYNADLPVRLVVSDLYSGIKEIKYKIGSADEVTIDFTNDNNTNEIKYYWDSDVDLEQALILNAISNDRNDVEVDISYIDNAGNPHNERTFFKILYKVDVTAPVIDISYNNNNAANGRYFKAARTMTVKITELNLSYKDVVFTIKKDGQSYNSLIPKKWTRNGNVHTTTINFASDGDYTFDISCKDLAGNKNKGVDYGNSVAPKAFTVDNVDPVITVTYDNNNSTNGSYFNKGRVATIAVNEHNFDASKSIVTVTAKTRINGTAIGAPSASKWRHESADRYTAVVNFSSDAFYSIEVASTDLANRAAAKFNKEEFTVDATRPEVEVTNVKHQSANAGKDSVIAPVVTVNDTNVSYTDIKIVLVGAKNGEVFHYENGSFSKLKYGNGALSGANNSTVFKYTFENIKNTKENDDIYTLGIIAKDMAGNTNLSIKALTGDNKQVELKDNKMMFSVNRFGSTYMLDEKTKKIFSSVPAYVQEAPEIIVHEINPDAISGYTINKISSISVNGSNNQTLVEGKNFKVGYYDPTKQSSQNGINKSWYENTYTIYKSNFEKDDEYTVQLMSNDKASIELKSSDKNEKLSFRNNAGNEYNKLDIRFVVDTQKPTGRITIEGANSSNVINGKEATVFIVVNDNNCDYLKCEIILDGKKLFILEKDGKIVVSKDENGIDQIGELDDEKGFVLTVKNSGKEFKHSISFKAVDKSGRVSELITPPNGGNFTLSENFWIRFVYTKPLFYGTIAGVVAIAAGIIFFFAWKRKKENEGLDQF